MTEKLLRLFATPVIVDDELAATDALNAELARIILAQQKKDAGLRLSNRGGWQSKHDFPRWAGEPGRRLIEHALSLANAHTIGFKPDSAPPWAVDVWANVSVGGNFNMPHVHGGSYWSAVYYVQLGDGEGGQLVLHDPRMPALRMHAPGVRFKDAGPELRVDLPPKAGRMMLFPAWLSHSVEPWEGTGSRISVAMNIRVANVRS